uniref:Uncharacterized protein n=1 Tax=Arundo donax TaxID=35708 RepID=A0A0A9HQB2_ARUDO
MGTVSCSLTALYFGKLRAVRHMLELYSWGVR